jgi:uncharacterized damage-inducible protein DinB
MSVGITMNELLIWQDESARSWKAHLEANPALLDVPCSIGGAGTVQGFVRHIWSAEMRWVERLAALPLTPREEIPTGPVSALYELHERAAAAFRELLAAPEESWNGTIVMDVPSLPEGARAISRRKALAHALFHSQRHWAQLATLAREAGFPAKHGGDLLFSSAL